MMESAANKSSHSCSVGNDFNVEPHNLVRSIDCQVGSKSSGSSVVPGTKRKVLEVDVVDEEEDEKEEGCNVVE